MDFTAGFVLHTRPYRDTSLIVELFTLEHGRVSVVAKGAAAGGKRNIGRKAALQLFNTLALRWSGKGELKSLTDVELLSRHLLIGQRLFAGMYLNELLERLLPKHDPNQALYRQYAASIALLTQDGALEPILREFEWLLLNELGYGLSFDIEAESHQCIAPDQDYIFIEDLGFVPARQEVPAKFHLNGQALLDCSQQQWNENSLRAAKIVNRFALRSLLGARPLRSRALFS